MVFRTPSYLKSVVSRLGGKSSNTFATRTAPKSKAYAPALELGLRQDATKPHPVTGDFVPVFVAVGMMVMSASLGLYTGLHQLSRAPNVFVRKSRRETMAEVVEPDHVVEDADKFIKKSFFRKVAHIQAPPEPLVPIHQPCEILTRPPRADTLKSVGVDPKIK
ncbi:uncharacterized protein LOC130761323 [Actinidia eriantha]|uniref:uncharacterized protein LOC130761323 n=1 Tax=Actinidia eriantha TaxID=165200 RepID=UPI0025879A83|nr:uncharacterized protein LOC130761323 [Actinidia eriantha]